MFDAKTYAARRKALRRALGSGIALFLGNDESPMNYAANTYHFRQDSTFLYFFGLDTPGLAAVIDADEKKEILFGNDIDMEDIIWMGSCPTLKGRARRRRRRRDRPAQRAGRVPAGGGPAKGRPVHFLPLTGPRHAL